ncbi:MAG: fibronectin type III domain-containing protein [bacterium]|nr:fibronectin type III domain-containing protein [bacterium]
MRVISKVSLSIMSIILSLMVLSCGDPINENELPEAPGNLLAAAESSNQVKLTWNDNSNNEQGFKLERSTDSGFTSAATISLANNTAGYTDTDLTPETTYYYRVKADNTAGESTYSNEAAATTAVTPTTAPDAPASLAASAVSSTQVNIAWSDNSDNEQEFRLERSTNASFSGASTVTLVSNITSYSHTGLNPETTYYYRVKAYNAAGESAYSNDDSAATTAEAGSQIIADHTIVDNYANIPQYYIDEVKKMLLNMAGESHARGYLYGLELLESSDSRFAVNPVWDSAPEADTSSYLRVLKAIHTSGWDYMAGEEDIWTSASAVTGVNSHLEYCRNLSNTIDVFGWGWCWDMTETSGPGGTMDPVHKVRWAGRSYTSSGNQGRWGLDSGDTALTGNAISMSDYLAAIDNFIATNPTTTVFYTTGPVDGWTNSGENGYQRWLKHEYIRNHATADSSRILFDYADILTHDSSGVRTDLTWTDSESTVHTYAGIYSGYVGEYDAGRGTCHVSEEGVTRLGKAMWWMLARIAGWDGVSTD